MIRFARGGSIVFDPRQRWFLKINVDFTPQLDGSIAVHDPEERGVEAIKILGDVIRGKGSWLHEEFYYRYPFLYIATPNNFHHVLLVDYIEKMSSIGMDVHPILEKDITDFHTLIPVGRDMKPYFPPVPPAPPAPARPPSWWNEWRRQQQGLIRPLPPLAPRTRRITRRVLAGDDSDFETEEEIIISDDSDF